jgi:hypothetical protein
MGQTVRISKEVPTLLLEVIGIESHKGVMIADIIQQKTTAKFVSAIEIGGIRIEFKMPNTEEELEQIDGIITNFVSENPGCTVLRIKGSIRTFHYS